MKSKIHKYQGQRVKGVQVKTSDMIKLTPKDKKIFDKYITDCSGSAGERRVKKLSRELLVIHDTAEVGLDEWDYDTLSKFLAVLNNTELAKYTSNDYKKNLKSFLKFQYPDWNTRFRGLKHSGLKQVDPVNRKKINKQTLIKPNEFELLIRGCNIPLMKVYVHVAYKSAGRPEELLKLRFRDVDFDKGVISVYSSKTRKPREIPIDKACLDDILNYKNNEYAHPKPISQDDYIFVSPVKRSVPISTPTLHSNLKTVSKNKLARTDITPYFFRHTRLSFMIGKLSPKAYELFSGHSLEVGMKFYAHLDVDDLKEELFLNVFDKVELPKGERDVLELKIKEQDGRIEELSSHIMEINEGLKQIKKQRGLK